MTFSITYDENGRPILITLTNDGHDLFCGPPQKTWDDLFVWGDNLCLTTRFLTTIAKVLGLA